MLRTLLVTALFGSMPAGVAGDEARERNLADFDFVVAKIEANYAGYPTIVDASSRERLEALTRAQREAAGAAPDERAFAAEVARWLAFFQDRHVWLEPAASAAPPARAAVAELARLDWTEEDVRARLDELGPGRWPIEGVWEDAAGRSRMALLRDEGERVLGVVLRSAVPACPAGIVRAELERVGATSARGSVRADDGSEREVAAHLRGPERQLLSIGNGLGVWRRVLPAPARAVPPERVAALLGAAQPVFEELGERTLYVRLPDLYPGSKPRIDALLAEHRAALQSRENLILDLRDNPGGWDSVFAPLVPWIYSRPVYQLAHEHRSTPDNAAGNEALAADPTLTEDNRRWLQGLAAAMRARPGEFVVLGGRAASVQVLPEVRPRPARVAILIEGAASSAEQLVLAAQQSRKVTLFGRGNSAGVVDFGNVRDLCLPSGRFTLRYATSRSARLPDYPLDGVGIAPDVLIPDDVEDEVAFVREWLERGRR